MVGSDSDGELICCGGAIRRDCWCAAAAIRADFAVCSSLFDFGDVEKKFAILVTLGEDIRRGTSIFSLYGFSLYGGGGSIVIVMVGELGELLAKGFRGLRGIVVAISLVEPV